LRFINNAYFSYINIRKLGEINYSGTIKDFINIKDLGPDFLDLSKEEFIGLVKNRRGTIKYTLMHQKIIAGIGNEYSDEVLFQTRIHPEQSANELNKEELESVYIRLKEIIEVAIENNTNFSEYPDDFLIPNRGKNGNCPICGEKLKRIKVSGRSAYICPNRQKKK
jgi:formamidopyrimidine-DNA glycosylase